MEKVRQGDYLTGLDNGYVIEVDHDPVMSSYAGHGQYARIGDGLVLVTFNDADGGEGYLLAAPDMPVTVRTPREKFVG